MVQAIIPTSGSADRFIARWKDVPPLAVNVYPGCGLTTGFHKRPPIDRPGQDASPQVEGI